MWTVVTSGGMEIGVIGPGAVGTVLGGLLCAAGHRVTLYGRRPSAAGGVVSLEDATGDRRTITGLSRATLDAWNPRTELALVCVRGEQLASVLADSGRHPPRDATLAVASATLDPLTLAARATGWRGAILRLGVGFGAWRREDGVYRWFPMFPAGTGVGRESGALARPAQVRLARALTAAGLPARPAPARLFGWLLRTTYAMQTAQCLGFAGAGWNLAALADDAGLLAETARAMKEAAQVMRREGGPPALLAALAPVWLYRFLLRAASRRLSPDFNEVWRHHGPKVWPQVRFLVAQLNARGRARGVRTDAISLLAARADRG